MEYTLPELIISKELIERIQFSVASRNAEAKLAECACHVFAASYPDNPHETQWQYVSSGVACLLRNRELSKNGRKYMWSMSLCLYNASYGVLVWKAKLLQNSDYTAVADNFHVFALGEVNVLVGLMFSSKDKACELNTTYTTWHQERVRDDGKKGSVLNASQTGEPTRFRKEMISKPCNFQHIQGTQAIDECMDIEKIKADIIAAFFGLGIKSSRLESTDSPAPKQKSKKKKESAKPRLQFKEIGLPLTRSSSSPILSPPVSPVSPDDVPLMSPPVDPVLTESSPAALEYRSKPQVVKQLSEKLLSQLPDNTHSYPGNGYQDSGFQGSNYQDNRNQDGVGLQSPTPLSPSGYTPGFQSPGESQHSQSNDFTEGPKRDMQTSPPNYQNPASPAYQEYNSTSQGSYSYDLTPPRLDMNLEMDIPFKPSVVTAI